MDDREALDMMKRCLSELQQAKAQINHLAPRAEAFEVVRDIARFALRGGVMAAGEDVIWTLEKRIRELESKHKTEAKDG